MDICCVFQTFSITKLKSQQVQSLTEWIHLLVLAHSVDRHHFFLESCQKNKTKKQPCLKWSIKFQTMLRVSSRLIIKCPQWRKKQTIASWNFFLMYDFENHLKQPADSVITQHSQRHTLSSVIFFKSIFHSGEINMVYFVIFYLLICRTCHKTNKK